MPVRDEDFPLPDHGRYCHGCWALKGERDKLEQQRSDIEVVLADMKDVEKRARKALKALKE